MQYTTKIRHFLTPKNSNIHGHKQGKKLFYANLFYDIGEAIFGVSPCISNGQPNLFFCCYISYRTWLPATTVKATDQVSYDYIPNQLAQRGQLYLAISLLQYEKMTFNVLKNSTSRVV